MNNNDYFGKVRWKANGACRLAIAKVKENFKLREL